MWQFVQLVCKNIKKTKKVKLDALLNRDTFRSGKIFSLTNLLNIYTSIFLFFPHIMLYSLAVLSTLTVIEDSVTLRSNDLALLKLAKVELDTSGTERSFAESSDISYK